MLLVRTELRPSIIHGFGVFLKDSVKEGALVWERGLIDTAILGRELDELPDIVRKMVMEYATFSRDLDAWLLCGDNARFINHAPVSQATLLTATETLIDSINVASRDLPAGTELTIDYTTICDAMRDERPTYVDHPPHYLR